MTEGWCPFVERVPGVQTYTPGGLTRVGFCDHIAVGYMNTMRNPAFWNGAGVSPHFAVGKDGSAIQLVSIFDTAYAQGRLGPQVNWPPYADQATANPNDWLISFEHEGFPGEEWTPEMYATDLQIKRWCVEACYERGYNLMELGLDSLTGHYMFDGVDRASCPGPTWPRDRLWADLAQGEDDMATIVNRPGTAQNYLVVGRTMEFLHTRDERELAAAAYGIDAAPRIITQEAFNWLAKRAGLVV